MKWVEIASLPTIIRAVPPGAAGVHESLLRSYQAHQKVVDYLRRGVPGPVILELLEELDLIATLLQRLEQTELQRTQGAAIVIPVNQHNGGGAS